MTEFLLKVKEKVPLVPVVAMGLLLMATARAGPARVLDHVSLMMATESLSVERRVV